MAINDIFELGRMGMNANRKAMNTVATNVANANTVGYSRQRAQFVPNESHVVDGIRIGGGVDVKNVVRVHDQYVQNQILEESKSFGGLKMRVNALQQTENVVQREGERLGELINKFFNDFRELSVSPETPSLRNVVSATAENLSLGFRKMNDSLEALKADLDLKLEGTVGEINVLTKEISDLNGRIYNFEAYGEPPNELYDRRDQALRELAEKVDYQVFADERGQVNIIVANGTLVNGTEHNSMYTLRTPASGTKSAGNLDVFMKENLSDRNITHIVKDGTLGGILHVRDEIVNHTLESLDNIAYKLATETNAIHEKGVGLDGLTGRKLFADIGEGPSGASYRFNINADIIKNPDAIATGQSLEAPGDNSIALEMANLQHQELLPSSIGMGGDNRHTLNAALTSVVSYVGTHASRESNFYRHQEAVMNQLENYRQSMSGVSLEEEAINMMQYQLIFNASAKAMKTGDEMLQTVLSLKD